jgi:hypothetical protein
MAIEKIKIHYMLPDKEQYKENGIHTWHRVSVKKFKEEWAKNGLFEYVTSIYSAGDLCLYINRKKFYGDGKTKINWKERDKR